MLRSFLERTTRSWSFTRTLRIGERRIPIVVSPSAGLRYLFKPMSRVDPPLLSAAARFVKRGSVVWDVGANVGLFTFAAAAIAGPTGRVIAFEPDAWLVQLLRRSTTRQRRTAPATIVPAAVAQSCGVRSFTIARRSRSTSHLAEYGTTQTGGALEQQTVVALSLDFALKHFPPPDVLKIDVEGAEVEVLRGAGSVLAKRPTIICEFSRKTSAQVLPMLRQAGYDILDGETWGELNEWSSSVIAQVPSVIASIT